MNSFLEKNFKWIIILVSIALLFCFLAFFAKNYTSTKFEFDLNNKKVVINTEKEKNAKSISELTNFKEYFIKNGLFYFKLPKNNHWDNIQETSDTFEYLSWKDANISEFLRNQIIQNLETTPYGLMQKNGLFTRISSTKKIKLEITENTSSDELELLLEIQKRQNAYSEKQLKEIKTNFIKENIASSIISNEITVISLPKKYTKEFNYNYNIYDVLKQLLMISTNINMMEVKSRIAILITTNILRNVIIDGRETDCRIDTMFYLTENNHYYFIVEARYSPQTDESLSVWKELTDIIASFKVFDD